MKFSKNLLHVVAVCDPSWGPFWMNYKCLKKYICKIIDEERHDCRRKGSGTRCDRCVSELMKTSSEVDFFRELQHELRKTENFFRSEIEVCKKRKSHIETGFNLVKEGHGRTNDVHMINMVLQACLHFFKDMLFLENFAIMNYCAFSKILKKHDKHTGYYTRKAYLQNVVNHQSFSDHPMILDILSETEKLFFSILEFCNTCSLSHSKTITIREEENLFLNAIRDLNQQAGRLRAEEISTLFSSSDDASQTSSLTSALEDDSSTIISTSSTHTSLRLNRSHSRSHSAYYDEVFSILLSHRPLGSCTHSHTFFNAHSSRLTTITSSSSASSSASTSANSILAPMDALCIASNRFIHAARAAYRPADLAAHTSGDLLHPPANIRAAVKWVQNINRVLPSLEAETADDNDNNNNANEVVSP